MNFNFEEKIEALLEIQSDGIKVYYEDFYDNLKDLYVDIKKYLRKNPERKEEICILMNTIEKGNKNNVFYLNNTLHENNPEYAFKFQEILKLYETDIDKAVKKAQNFREKKDNFLYFVNKFSKKYINSKLYIDALNDIANHLENDEKVKRKTYINYEAFSDIENNKITLDLIYDSNLSVLDYAFYNRINYGDVNAYISTSIKNKTTNSKINEIYKRKSKTLPIILDIANKIINNQIDIIEYYELTKLSLIAFKRIVNQNNIKSPILNEFVRDNTNNFTINNTYEKNKVLIDRELNSKQIINNQEISNETKLSAYNYLEEIEAPLTYRNYNIMIKKLIKSSK